MNDFGQGAYTLRDRASTRKKHKSWQIKSSASSREIMAAGQTVRELIEEARQIISERLAATIAQQ